MTYLYQNEDLWNAVRQKRKLFRIFLAVTVCVVIGLVLLMTFYALLPYNDPTEPWYIAGSCVLLALYIIFDFLFMGISYKRSRAYCKMLRYISVGLKEYTEIPFDDIEDWTTRDGVDVNVAVFLIPNVKSDEEMFRQIYVDGEKDFPAFEKGKKAKMLLHGNLLIAYELEDGAGETA